jgi:hypothetical protein
MVLEGSVGKIISSLSGSEKFNFNTQNHKNEALGSVQNHRWFSVYAGFMYQKSETCITTTHHRVNFSLKQLHVRCLMTNLALCSLSSTRGTTDWN